MNSLNVPSSDSNSRGGYPNQGAVSPYTTAYLHKPQDFAEWDAFVDTSPQGSIFCNSWWLEAVCPGAFEILAVKRNGKIIAGMPLPFFEAQGRKIIRMPRLTQTLGVLLPPPASRKYESNLSYEMDLTRKLVQGLPEVQAFSVNCHFRFTNWLPFYWKGYQQTTNYTYRYEDLNDLPALFQGLSTKTRNIIRKAERDAIAVAETEDIESFFPLLAKTFQRQEMELPYPPDLVRRLMEACRLHGAGKLLQACDGQGKVHALVYFVFNKKCMYYTMQGSDPDLRQSGAGVLTLWRAIELAPSVTASFDFEGSMLEKVEHHFRSFGARQTPYFTLYRTIPQTTWKDLLRPWRNLFREKLTGILRKGKGFPQKPRN